MLKILSYKLSKYVQSCCENGTAGLQSQTLTIALVCSMCWRLVLVLGLGRISHVSQIVEVVPEDKERPNKVN